MQMELIPEADCSSTQQGLQIGRGPDGQLLRTSPVFSHRMEGATLLRWLESWLGPRLVFQEVDGAIPAWHLGKKDSSNGAYWMRNGGDWRNGASVCSLSEILETGSIDHRFYLSPKACAGILRRADNRGNELPTSLRLALEQVAGALIAPETPGDKTL